MLITPDFIFVHLSKTGGTFAVRTLKEVLCPSAFHRKIHSFTRRSSIQVPFYNYAYKELRQHGLCNDIPKEELGKAIVSCIRNPFDLYVSEYTFGWWKRYPEQWFHDLASIKTLYPEFYDLDFANFIAISNKHSRWVHKALKKHQQVNCLGWYSHKFVHYFCQDPDYVFEVANDDDRLLERVKESMYPIHFLHANSLNQELYEFLLSQGFKEECIGFIRTKGRINASRNDHEYRNWYSDSLRREVERKDALIFKLFPEFHF